MSDVPPPGLPPITVVSRVVSAFAGAGLTAALGGSGLLVALGLSDTAADWDVTVDGDPDVVRRVLRDAGLDVAAAPAGDGRFGTRARFVFEESSERVELLVGFAIRVGGRRVAIPTRVSRSWRGLPIGDPSAWATAYRLLDRVREADLLDAYLASASPPPLDGAS